MSKDDCGPEGYASPPCLMHELDPACFGLEPADPQQRRDVMRWRKAARETLIAERLAIPGDQRRLHAEAIATALTEEIGDVSGAIVSFYWPFRGEPDLRGVMTQLAERGAVTALPVVVKRRAPLQFRAWSAGEPLERGVWNIPAPSEGKDVLPDIIISPVVGFDGACYRLGYGGGYYDRTLAALPQTPRIFGVGYAQAALSTIYPQPHDIPMDVIVTETGIMRR